MTQVFKSVTVEYYYEILCDVIHLYSASVPSLLLVLEVSASKYLTWCGVLHGIVQVGCVQSDFLNLRIDIRRKRGHMHNESVYDLRIVLNF